LNKLEENGLNVIMYKDLLKKAQRQILTADKKEAKNRDL